MLEHENYDDFVSQEAEDEDAGSEDPLLPTQDGGAALMNHLTDIINNLAGIQWPQRRCSSRATVDFFGFTQFLDVHNCSLLLSENITFPDVQLCSIILFFFIFLLYRLSIPPVDHPFFLGNGGVGYNAELQ